MERFFVEGLAQASFLICSGSSDEAIVIDPRRDVEAYLDVARRRGARIRYAIETHIHADFVSGARELAAAGAQIVCGPGADLGFVHREVRHEEVITLGEMTLTFLHTPGHTPEHISVLLQTPGEPVRLFSGDTLFVGAVGRPDLLGVKRTHQLAGQLYDSLFDVLLRLDDRVEVHPGHGAGSMCGRGIGAAPSSTIGDERRLNSMLQTGSRETFIAAVMADLPETPAYFPRLKQLNRVGPAVLGLAGGVAPTPSIEPKAAQRLLDSGAIMIDTRDAAAFGRAHPRGAVNIGFGARLGYWAGWLLPPDVPLVLMTADDRTVPETVRHLLRVGLDDVRGCVQGGFDAWCAAQLPSEALAQIPASSLRPGGSSGLRLIDVRAAGEWRDGHIEGALHIPLGDIPARAATLPDNARLGLLCEGGYRSSLAASLLQRAGVTNLVNVSGGMAEYRRQVDGSR